MRCREMKPQAPPIDLCFCFKKFRYPIMATMLAPSSLAPTRVSLSDTAPRESGFASISTVLLEARGFGLDG